MKLLVDMNLAPAWCDFLIAAGHDAAHWWAIGPPDAPDHVVMAHARASGRAVLTHDLDFGAILAATNADGPSVIQIRARVPSVHACGAMVAGALTQFHAELLSGAILTIASDTAKVRVLPLRPPPQL